MSADTKTIKERMASAERVEETAKALKNGTPIETPWEKTQRLLNDSIIAVNTLSRHLEEVPDQPRMFKANQALRILWEIE